MVHSVYVGECTKIACSDSFDAAKSYGFQKYRQRPIYGCNEPNEKLKRLQLATVQARLGELQRRAAGESDRAQKERQRKQRQKAG